MSDVKRNLEPQAYESLLRRADLCDTHPDYDWDSEPKDRRHAMNAVLDLEVEKKQYETLHLVAKQLKDALGLTPCHCDIDFAKTCSRCDALEAAKKAGL